MLTTSVLFCDEIGLLSGWLYGAFQAQVLGCHLCPPHNPYFDMAGLVTRSVDTLHTYQF